MVNAAIRQLKSQAPGIFTGGVMHYFYAHYYAIQAMVQAGDREYSDWYPKIRDALVSQQNAQGGWSKTTTPGTISYETPMAIIILATPHRYIPIYQR
jgi:squalene cyclase